MKKRFWALACAGLMLLPAAGCGQQDPLTTEIYAMDTVMDLDAYGDAAQTALDESEAEITRLENLFSRTKADSEISKLNSAGGAPVAVDGEVADILRSAIEYSSATSGAFDVTVAPIVSAWGFTTDSYQVPDQAALDALLPAVGSDRIQVDGDTVTLGAGQSVDLGGIAKGYASDQIAAIYRKCGVTSGKIYLGGNVWVCGSKPDGSPWRVAVQDPNDSQGQVGVLSLTDAFAITSGGYQRYFEQDGKIYHHIIDPSTGYPAESGLVSVTIVASEGYGTGTMCDTFSTALFVMGEEKAVEFWRSGRYDFNMVLVTSDNRVLVSDGIADQFEQSGGSDYTYETIH
jgi:thiamine biosynthesis lipoprotein